MFEPEELLRFGIGGRQTTRSTVAIFAWITSHTGVNDAFWNARSDAWLSAAISAHDRYASVARSSFATCSSMTGATARPRAAGATNTLWM